LHRDLVPAIRLPRCASRRERKQAPFRLHLVKRKSMLRHRIHATLTTFAHQCWVSDLFGLEGRKLLDRVDLPDPRGVPSSSVGRRAVSSLRVLAGARSPGDDGGPERLRWVDL
jgi:hypothetical protein